MITQYLNKVMDIYLQSNNKHVDRNCEEYQLVCQNIPDLLREELNFNGIFNSREIGLLIRDIEECF